MSLDDIDLEGAPEEASRLETPEAALVVVHSPEKYRQGERYSLADADVTIGREEGNAILVPSDQASRRHCRIFASGGAHVIVDLESTNGTYVNSKPVKEQTLQHGDVIRVASTVLKYVVQAPPTRTPA